MNLFKRNKPASTEPAAEKQKVAKKTGRPLLLYLLPTVLVAIVLLLLMIVMLEQLLRAGHDDMAVESARTVSGTVAERVSGYLQGRRDLLQLMAHQERYIELLQAQDADALRAAEKHALDELGSIVQLRILPADVAEPDPTGPAPLGYAGLDMIRRVVQQGAIVNAEVHQLNSGLPYIALAVPLVQNNVIKGVLFSAWSVKIINNIVAGAPVFPGDLWVTQGTGGSYVLARSGEGVTDVTPDGRVAVPGSIWVIKYLIRSRTVLAPDLMLLAGLFVGGLAALLLTIFLQYRMLARDLKQDMSTLLHLGESILSGEGIVAQQAQVRYLSDAVLLLTDYARSARIREKRAPRAKNPAQSSHDAAKQEAVSENVAEAAEKRPELPEALFQAYDVRGLVKQTLTPQVAGWLGQALGSQVVAGGGNRILVSSDVRLSSPALSKALLEGITASGCDATDLGQAPVSLLYQGLQVLPAQAGVMVTGGHNPADYNGFRIVVDGRPLSAEELKALRQTMLNDELKSGKGQVQRQDLAPDYIEHVVGELQVARPLKIVVDAGNGVVGDIACRLLQALECQAIPLFCEPDGRFPNHFPDPSQPENLASLALEVQAQQADLGIAFDGDGSRLGVVDSKGDPVSADQILMLLAGDVLERHPGSDVIYDVKSSRHLAAFVLGRGGRPIMWKSGYSRMQEKMRDTGALLGGEFSGHFFIKERWHGMDDAVYAAARMIEILAVDPRESAEVFGELPSGIATPEYQLILDDVQNDVLMAALKARVHFDDSSLIDLDGLRVEFPNGWGLVRLSNTMPALVFRFEADDEATLESIKQRFRDLFNNAAPDLPLPF